MNDKLAASLVLNVTPPPTPPSIPVIDVDSLASRVVQLELSSSLKAGLHAGVSPQLLDDVSQLRGHRAFFNGV